ncbi:Signal-Transducing Adaptor Protein 2 [Manis pentadactyla]|nr:Signal-Transducing Adaptor Protein 2 [Manis pentadactyla]
MVPEPHLGMWQKPLATARLHQQSEEAHQPGVSLESGLPWSLNAASAATVKAGLRVQTTSSCLIGGAHFTRVRNTRPGASGTLPHRLPWQPSRDPGLEAGLLWKQQAPKPPASPVPLLRQRENISKAPLRGRRGADAVAARASQPGGLDIHHCGCKIAHRGIFQAQFGSRTSVGSESTEKTR